MILGFERTVYIETSVTLRQPTIKDKHVLIDNILVVKAFSMVAFIFFFKIM
ncbi:hypothetical protein Bca101_004945 [Brassica carinata]